MTKEEREYRRLRDRAEREGLFELAKKIHKEIHKGLK